jgi:phage shock protein PspC (stress-responsive transcriptional regulator)
VRRLYLSKTDKKIFGVCGGIGKTYDIDPTLIRLALVLLCLVTAILPVAATYLIAWVIIPEKPVQ